MMAQITEVEKLEGPQRNVTSTILWFMIYDESDFRVSQQFTLALVGHTGGHASALPRRD